VKFWADDHNDSVLERNQVVDQLYQMARIYPCTSMVSYCVASFSGMLYLPLNSLNVLGYSQCYDFQARIE
jgi:hypothetical protein